MPEKSQWLKSPPFCCFHSSPRHFETTCSKTVRPRRSLCGPEFFIHHRSVVSRPLLSLLPGAPLRDPNPTSQLSLSPPLPLLLLLLSPSHSLPASTPPATPPLSSARRRKSLASAALWMSGVLPLCGGAARKVASSAHPQWWPGAHPPALAQVAMGSDVQLRIWRNEGCDMLFPYNTAYEVFFQKQGKC